VIRTSRSTPWPSRVSHRHNPTEAEVIIINKTTADDSADRSALYPSRVAHFARSRRESSIMSRRLGKLQRAISKARETSLIRRSTTSCRREGVVWDRWMGRSPDRRRLPPPAGTLPPATVVSSHLKLFSD